MLVHCPDSPPYPKPTVNSEDRLFCVCTLFNPERYQSRYRLHKEFEEYVARSAGAQLLTVEVAFADRPFILTSKDNPWHVQLRCHDVYFVKERSANVAVSRLSELVPNWKYLAHVDGDVRFSRDDWAIETVQELQHWPVVQMWAEGLDLGPSHSVVKKFYSFAYCKRHGLNSGNSDDYTYGGVYEHPGFCWAYTRSAWRTMGGLADVMIVGSGDYYMAHGLMGTVEPVIPRGVTPGYRGKILDWQKDAKDLRGLIGYVRTTLLHAHHGRKSDRGYKTRNAILIDNAYDPDRDLRLNEWMLYQLEETKPGLKADLETYFRSRHEDALDI